MSLRGAAPRAAGAARRIAGDARHRTIRLLRRGARAGAGAAVMLVSPTQRSYLLRFLRSRAPGYLLAAPSPWLTFGALEFLGRRLRRGMRIFEYGSGGSTLFWVRADASCVSVEHDPAWFADVLRRLPSSATVDYRLVEPEPAEGSGDPAEPDDYASTSAAFRGRRFRRYAAQIDDFPDGHFDVVLIDGRARPSCIKHAAPKVAAEGLLIVDNTDRAYYVERTSSYLAPFEPRRFEGFGPVNAYRWETTIFIRPAAGEAAPR